MGAFVLSLLDFLGESRYCLGFRGELVWFLGQQKTKKGVASKAFMLIWSMWKARNEVVF